MKTIKTERLGDFYRLHDELRQKTGKSLPDWKSSRDKRVGFFCKSSAPLLADKTTLETIIERVALSKTQIV